MRRYQHTVLRAYLSIRGGERSLRPESIDDQAGQTSTDFDVHVFRAIGA